MKLNIALVLPLFLVAACATTATLPKGDVIGQEMKAQSATRFAVVDASPKEFFNKTVLVEARIKAVCQKAGCWMQVEDEGRTTLVRWETGCGGKYTFPKDAAGKKVLIQGSFYPKPLSEDDAKHMEAEAGSKLTLKRDGYEFNASAVMLIDG